LAQLDAAPCGFHYSLDTIVISIRLVVFGLLSLRGTGRALDLFSAWFNGGVPCHVVVQNWLMRLGIYRLGKPPEKRNDWIFILDHTIDFGTKKCLVILGVTVEKLMEKECRLSHEDIQALDISIVENATAKSVEKRLWETAQKTGIPVQIVSDNGRNLAKGITDFIGSRREIKHTYDVTHKAAILLKHHLKNDLAWKDVTEKMWNAKRDLLFTRLGFLAPPKPKDKARWLNLDMYLEWIEKASNFRKCTTESEDAEIFDKKLGWIEKLGDSLAEWRNMLDLLKRMKTQIKSDGFRKDSLERFEQDSFRIPLPTKRIRLLKNEITGYLKEETEGLDDKQVRLGTSDIIESVFGRYKEFSGKTPMKEIGRSVLTIPVFTGELNHEEVKAAMENVSASDVESWMKQNIGESFFSKRKKAFSLINKKNQVKLYPDKLKNAASF
jgi:hypothetical protein